MPDGGVEALVVVKHGRRPNKENGNNETGMLAKTAIEDCSRAFLHPVSIKGF